MLAVSDLLTVCGWPMRWLFVGVASCYEKRNAPLVFTVLILMRWNSALHRRQANPFSPPFQPQIPKPAQLDKPARPLTLTHYLSHLLPILGASLCL